MRREWLEEIHWLSLAINLAILSKSKAKLSLIFLILLTAVFASQLNKVRFNYDFNMFFPKGDDNFDYYEKYMEEFGTDNDYLLVSIPNEDITSPQFLQKVDLAIEEIGNWNSIKRVFGLTNTYNYQITPLGANRLRIVDPTKALDLKEVSEKSKIAQQFIAKDTSSIAFTIEHTTFEIKTSADSLYEKINTYLDSEFDEVVISGKIQAQYHFVKKLEKELVLLLALAMGLISIVLFLIFRTLKGVVLPFLILIIVSIWNLGLIALIGKDLDVMMIMVPPILLVVAMSDLIHFCSKYNELKSRGESTSSAIKETFRTVGAATLLTSISTAVGFASLVLSAMPPIRDFGLFTAIGVLLAYIITFSLLPCLFTLFEKPLNKSSKGEIKWTGFMHALFSWVISKRRLILPIGLIFSVLLGAGILVLRQNTFIIVGLKKSDPLLQKVNFFDEQYGGAKTLEMAVQIKNGELFDPEILAQLEKISSFLTQEYGLNHLISPLETIKALNRGISGPDHYTVPNSSKDIQRIKKLYYSRRFSEGRSQLESSNLDILRFTGRIQDIGSFEARKKNLALANFFASEIDDDLISYRLTGTSFLVDNTDKYVARSLLKGLGFGLLVITVLLAVLFRNLRFTLISLVPNVVPLVILAGILGYMNIDLNITTMLIFGIAFGIAVDDSIHFLSRYQQELRLGKSPIYASKRTFISTGKSIVLTTIVLSTGFGLFLFSGFSATSYTGIFVGITLIIALAADLLILPILLFPTKIKN